VSAWIVVVVVFVLCEIGGQEGLSDHYTRRIAVFARRLRINKIIRPERAEKQAAWQRVKSKAMTEEARIIIV
jgi:D-alanyl-D-alanine dipeptidase